MNRIWWIYLCRSVSITVYHSGGQVDSLRLNWDTKDSIKFCHVSFLKFFQLTTFMMKHTFTSPIKSMTIGETAGAHPLMRTCNTQRRGWRLKWGRCVRNGGLWLSFASCFLCIVVYISRQRRYKINHIRVTSVDTHYNDIKGKPLQKY